MALSVMGLIVLAIPVACLLGLVWLWVRVLRKPTMQHAVCGHCQYIVEGLPTLFCPECGSDFRKVGIQTPSRQGHVEPANFLAAWTALLLPLAMLISGVVISIGPQRVIARSSASLSPQSKSFGEVTLRFWSEFGTAGFSGGGGMSTSSGGGGGGNTVTFGPSGSTPARVADRIELTISAGGMNPPADLAPALRVYPGTGTYRYGNTSGNGFSQSTLEDWLAELGFSAQTSGLRADAGELFALLDACARGRPSFTTTRYGSIVGSSSSRQQDPHPWLLGGVALFWLGVYVAGIVLYRRRRLWQAVQEALATP